MIKEAFISEHDYVLQKNKVSIHQLLLLAYTHCMENFLFDNIGIANSCYHFFECMLFGKHVQANLEFFSCHEHW